MKAMILAAGRGTRMLPLTETKPKALLEIQGVALLEHTIHYLKYHQVDEIIINIHHHPQQIVDFITRNHSFGIRIAFSDESEELLDTGGGLYKARGFFSGNEPFILTSTDVITNLNLSAMLENHISHQALATLAVKHRKSSRDFIFDPAYRLSGWHNNITGETRMVRAIEEKINIAFSTIHIINPSLFDLIEERGRFSIIELYLRLAKEYMICGYEHDASLWYECGKIEYLPSLNQNVEIPDMYKKYHFQQGNM
jgi:NDP-sugar pyrophosphorylase family protein